MVRIATGLVVSAFLAASVAWLLRAGTDDPAPTGESGFLPPGSIAVTSVVPKTGSRGMASRESVQPADIELTREEPEGTESAVSWELRNIIYLQREDGGWGEAIEDFEGQRWSRLSATALALLSLLGAGYSHLSKESWIREPDGTIHGFGTSIRHGLKWLKDQRPSNGLDAALVAMAWNEQYGMTNSTWSIAPAVESLACLDAWQHGDGSWGDSFHDFSAMLALTSARNSKLDHAPVSFDRARLHLRDRLDMAPDAAWVASALLVQPREPPEALGTVRAELLSRLPDSYEMNFTRFWVGTIVMFHSEAPDGEGWKAWNKAVRDTLKSAQRKGGSFGEGLGLTASTVRDAIAALTLEIYYRY